MTVIVWDGCTLAADKRSTFGQAPITTTKIRRVREGKHLIGAAGSTAKCRGMVDWYDKGAEPSTYKDFGDAQLLVVDEFGQAWMYDEAPWPVALGDAKVAIGSGMGEALVALACGKTAAEAVELVNRFNTTCGNGIDVLTLHE